MGLFFGMIQARDVRAVNNYHIGAWLQNVTHADGKVTGDMYFDSRYAESSEKGNRLDEMAAGTNSDLIYISTDLLYSGIAANGESNGKKYNEIATNMMFDHVAVLLNEPGAGTPDEGVGIFVNSEGEEQELEVVNLAESEIPDPALPQDRALKTLFNQLKAFFCANNHSVKEEANPMKELITNALKAKGIDVEVKSDAELMDAFRQMVADNAKAKAEAEKRPRKRKKRLTNKPRRRQRTASRPRRGSSRLQTN